MTTRKSIDVSSMPSVFVLPQLLNIYSAGRLGMAHKNAITVIPVHQAADRGALKKEFDAEIWDAIEAQRKDHVFTAAAGATRHLRINDRRVALIGLGADSADRSNLCWAGALAAQAARDSSSSTAEIVRGSIPASDWLQTAVHMAEGAELGSFTFQQYKNNPDSPQTRKRLHFAFADESHLTTFNRAVHDVVRCASAANFARHLANHPPNVINPTTLTQICRQLAKQCGLRCTVINFEQATRLSMGGLCSVGRGSPNKPAMIILEHKPSSSRSGPPIALVGKAVTFDTGGISIKPAAGMGRMKYDKCGGMAVIGVAAAAAMMNLPRHVVCVIPTAENMVDGEAYRPGDIIRMYNSKTVDVTNTDAEGRLILADAISYVCKHYHPSAVVDLATLTGGVVTALGGVYAGLMANDDALAEQLIGAGRAADELLWRLPLNPRYRKLLDSPHADMVNSGDREAHPIQGGIFLQEFVTAGTPWAHLDIAGVSYLKEDYRYLKGLQASGFGVRLIIEFIKSRG